MPKIRRRGVLITLAVLAATAVVVLAPRAPTAEPLLANGGMEAGTTQDTLYWTLDGGPYSTQFNEINGPESWVAWWIEGPLCTGTSDWRMGRPEVKVISTIPDPERVHSGEKATQWFTFWHCHSGGLLQRVAVIPGHYYTFSIYAHAWFSECDAKPHYNLPLDKYCDVENPILWAQDWLSVGVDPTGGFDPTAAVVEWGQAHEIYGGYGDEPLTVRFLAQEAIVTVIVKSEASHPLKHDDFYLDDAMLLDTTYRIFLPVIRSN